MYSVYYKIYIYIIYTRLHYSTVYYYSINFIILLNIIYCTATTGMEPPTPTYVLRAHTADVTAICLCDLEVMSSSGAGASGGGESRGDSDCDGEATTLCRTVLASGSTDGILKLWDLESRRVVLQASEHGGRGILEIAWKDGLLHTQGRDGFIKIWKLRARLGPQDELSLNLDSLLVTENRSYTFTRFSLLTEASVFAAQASNDTFFEIWNAETGDAIIAHSVARKNGAKTGMIMSLKMIVLRGATGMSQSQAEVATGAASQNSRSSLAPNDDLDHTLNGIRAGDLVSVVVGVESGEIGVFKDVMNRKHSISIGANTGEESEHKSAEFPVASSVLGLTGDDATWCTAHEEPVLCNDVVVHRSCSSRLIGVSGSADKYICVFTLSNSGTFEDVHKIALKSRGVADVRLRQDGRLFAAACWDGHVRIYGVKKRRQLAVLRFHSGGVHAVAFPPKDTLAAANGLICSSSKDARIAVWEIYPSS